MYESNQMLCQMEVYCHKQTNKKHTLINRKIKPNDYNMFLILSCHYTERVIYQFELARPLVGKLTKKLSN